MSKRKRKRKKQLAKAARLVAKQLDTKKCRYWRVRTLLRKVRKSLKRIRRAREAREMRRRMLSSSSDSSSSDSNSDTARSLAHMRSICPGYRTIDRSPTWGDLGT